jgi:membrane protein insertase Oxa1/YidC/SpoIIIJ
MTTPRNIGDERQQSMNNTMLWMMPLMFAWFTLTVPSGLGLYWCATNIIGVTLQYFYMRPAGQTWREVFLPARAPARQVAPATQAENKEGVEEPVAETASTASESRGRRRRSRGRRRGKR